ncbi:hypothetical protein A3C98_04440 [Candidatus Roizmanbacteria bacterium RIFCSPHIGHO2_02_FULL_37_15]|uniref:Uncharacterized protein n=1 Tax=Candidatus Roizmanbacteria bacterium RIFCSPLOWO2_01_FULL_37_16 TaxID=1802058 RepID=A0A1F7IIM2_9BACT|nr:MAG: hypothetical protein A2859_01695 [Candidatus Roizmanbacteria bacterium RIFCSPHIGHO2_01_FULL_37_16b]OGK20741.1 MAG: hypothetical protein A3C98_04440 [Candidatus Roizmanbacteria bacterium RIFCSPHIGHO2_02_FULL_37_15]OGK33027.1 MAG: hypothetical protein A3F57_06545 [Candidatus Roizmanbacteria bacterium RIFCSPHIGHO2_12_FULL_36_11]OGK43205.1 MAG: hypothetical protein A3B40_02990 [Candidatus Roizmanbacteria bacterium RIFCSPLOWO2_01_FULL_37_16]OGK57645.1 MAG: hypothetical protein A3I50_00810 [C
MQKIKGKAIVFIQKDKFEYFDESLSRIFYFLFQPTIIHDLELVDKDQLIAKIKFFVESNKIQKAKIIFIIADAITFEKTFPITPNINKDLEIEKFLENIPFEHVSYKVIDGQKDYRVLATNKELFQAIESSFEVLGFNSLAIIPQLSLADPFRLNPSLSADMIKFIFSHLDLLKKQSFTQEEMKPSPQPSSEETPVDAKKSQLPVNKYRLPILLSVFVLSLLLLSIFVYLQYPRKSKATPIPSAATTPYPSPSPEPAIQETPISSPSASPT